MFVVNFSGIAKAHVVQNTTCAFVYLLYYFSLCGIPYKRLFFRNSLEFS